MNEVMALAGCVVGCIGLLGVWLALFGQVEPICPTPAIPVSDNPKEPTYEDTEAALFDTLQAAEYRIPYTVPPEWPLMDCDHEWEEIRTYDGRVTDSFCPKCRTSSADLFIKAMVRGIGTTATPYIIEGY